MAISSVATSIGLSFSLLGHSGFSIPLCFAVGAFGGLLLALLLRRMETLFNRFDLRSIGILLIGLSLGVLVAQSISGLFGFFLQTSTFLFFPAINEIFEALIFLGSIYLSLLATAQAAESYTIELPFLKLKPTKEKSSNLLLDPSALSDRRLVEVAATGIFDNQLIVPRAYVKLLESQANNDLEANKARSALDCLRRLESLDHLGLRFIETPLPKSDKERSPLASLAKLLDARILTAEASRVQESSFEGASIVNIHRLATALKPLMQGGETIELKMQREGKEQRQGVGYLEDGTMVVVNGGGDYIDQMVRCTVLSVKQTSSGRMIFCNVAEDFIDGRNCRANEREKSRANLPGSRRAKTEHDYFNV